MNVATVSANKWEAKEKYLEYRKAWKERRGEQNRVLRMAYLAVKRGHKVVDLLQTFRETGLNAEGNPKLGFARGDMKRITFHKQHPGRGMFDSADMRKPMLELPAETFPAWPTEKATYNNGASYFWQIKNDSVRAMVPMVPPNITSMVTSLYDHFILWEVDKWQPTLAPRDPILLKRIGKSYLFTVIATWDLTELERAVIGEGLK